jgi:hypothetical protein
MLEGQGVRRDREMAGLSGRLSHHVGFPLTRISIVFCRGVQIKNNSKKYG